MMNESPPKRKHRRVKFVYPVEFKVLSPGFESRSFVGLFSTISMAGGGFHCEEKYGLIDPEKTIGAKIKPDINVLQEDQIFLFARVRSVKRDDSKQDLTILIGVEFEELLDWQIEKLEKIISLRDKDRKMMWNLWEHYVEESPVP
ncbi:MAG: PilZ domain-containing protein [Nitrospirota bacterium]